MAGLALYWGTLDWGEWAALSWVEWSALSLEVPGPYRVAEQFAYVPGASRDAMAVAGPILSHLEPTGV